MHEVPMRVSIATVVKVIATVVKIMATVVKVIATVVKIIATVVEIIATVVKRIATVVKVIATVAIDGSVYLVLLCDSANDATTPVAKIVFEKCDGTNVLGPVKYHKRHQPCQSIAY